MIAIKIAIKKSARECLGLVPLLQVKGDASFSIVLEVKIFRKLPAYFNFQNETRENQAAISLSRTLSAGKVRTPFSPLNKRDFFIVWRSSRLHTISPHVKYNIDCFINTQANIYLDKRGLLIKIISLYCITTPCPRFLSALLKRVLYVL